MKKIVLSNLVVLFAASASVFAATRLVPSEYSTIQAAIDDCNNGDVAIVAPGHWNLYTDEILNPKTWYYIVGVFDRAGDTGRVYVDGVKEAEGAMTTDPL